LQARDTSPFVAALDWDKAAQTTSVPARFAWDGKELAQSSMLISPKEKLGREHHMKLGSRRCAPRPQRVIRPRCIRRAGLGDLLCSSPARADLHRTQGHRSPTGVRSARACTYTLHRHHGGARWPGARD